MTFRLELTLEDLKNFMSILAIGPVALNSMGGAEVYLARKEVKGLLLNEMSYANLLEAYRRGSKTKKKTRKKKSFIEEIDEEIDEISEEELGQTDRERRAKGI